MNRILKNKAGITLIELLITVVIIGVVAAMAAPRFEIAYNRMKFKSANRDMVSTLKLARSMAITDKAQYGMYFDATAKTYTLFRDGADSSYAYEPSIDSAVRVDTLPSEFNYVATDLLGNVLFFRPNGSADFSGGGNVYSMAYSNKVIALFDSNILASTGRVHSESHYY